MLTKLCERIVIQTQVAINIIQGNFDKQWAGERIKYRPADGYKIFVFLREIKLLLLSQWVPLSLFPSVGLVMHREGAQKFPNTLGEIGRNSLCRNLLWRVYSLKPLPYTPVTPFPLRLKSSSEHQTRDYLLISF